MATNGGYNSFDWGSFLNAGLNWLQTGQPPVINFQSPGMGGTAFVPGTGTPGGLQPPPGYYPNQTPAPAPGDLIPGIPNWVLIVGLLIVVLILAMWRS